MAEARATILERYTIEKMIERYESLYDGVLEGRIGR